MMTKQNMGVVALLLTGLAVVTTGCRDSAPAVQPIGEGEKELTVYVVNYPLKYFAERISAGAVTVVLPVAEGADPADWRPKEAEISDFQQADLILLNGADYASWIQRAPLPESRLFNTSAAFEGELIEVEDAIIHTHGPDGEHSHHGLASHVWLDPRLASQQAAAIADALKKMAPDQAEKIEENLAALRSDLDDLDKSLQRFADQYKNQPLLVSHPVYQYLARRCGWNVVHSLHWEPDTLPNAKQWEEFEKSVQEHSVRWMIWEGPPIEEIESKLQSLGIKPVVFHTCGGQPGNDDYLQVMRENIERLNVIIQNDDEVSE